MDSTQVVILYAIYERASKFHKLDMEGQSV